MSTPGHVPAKRQTLTGIRTTPQHTARRPLPISSKTVETLGSSETPKSSAAHVRPNEADKKGSDKSRRFSDKDHNKVLEVKAGFKKENGASNLSRKSKRLEGRRHLTIGKRILLPYFDILEIVCTLCSSVKLFRVRGRSEEPIEGTSKQPRSHSSAL